MDLTDRYVQAVGFWLPQGQKRDIMAELNEDIRSEIEEREGALGHSLSACELEELLKGRGRPLAVAGRYLPQRSLIGPLWFPAYWLVLRIVAMCYLLPWAIIWFSLAPFRFDLPSQLLAAFIEGWVSWWGAAFFAWGVVTAVFASLERLLSKEKFLEDWSPRKLPRPRSTQENIPRLGSIIEIAAGIIGTLWWVQIVLTHTVWSGRTIQIQLAKLPIWLIAGFILLSLIGVVNACVNLVRPYWTYRRVALRLLNNVVAGAFFGIAARLGTFIVVSGSGIEAAKVAEINRIANGGIALSFVIASLICLIIAITDAVRMARLNGRQMLTNSVPGSA